MYGTRNNIKSGKKSDILQPVRKKSDNLRYVLYCIDDNDVGLTMLIRSYILSSNTRRTIRL